MTSTGYAITKRSIDVIGALLLLVLFSPLLLVVAAAVKLETRGPALYRGRRVGKHRAEFEVFKFRTMHHGVDDAPHREFVQALLSDPNASAATMGMYKLTDDDRVTRVGRRLRRWSVDELPQLLNVLRGDMSLVGPRPEVPYALEGYQPSDFRRFDVLPGMTGLWQVEGRANLSPRDMLELDRMYTENCSLALDLRLLLRTLPAVFKKVGSA